MFLIFSVIRPMQLRKTVFSKYIQKNILRFVRKVRLSSVQQDSAMTVLSMESSSRFARLSDKPSEKDGSLAEIYSRSASYFYSSESPLFSGSQKGYGQDSSPVLE